MCRRIGDVPYVNAVATSDKNGNVVLFVFFDRYLIGHTVESFIRTEAPGKKDFLAAENSYRQRPESR